MNKERVSSFDARLSEALQVRRMKQSELCQLAKIPKSSLSQYLSGDYEPKQDRIYLIAKVLRVSEAWLMGYDVPMERDKKVPTDESDLNDGEKLLLDLFRQIPAEKQELVLQMIRVALGKQS